VDGHPAGNSGVKQTAVTFRIFFDDLTVMDHVQYLIACQSVLERFLKGVKVEAELALAELLTYLLDVHPYCLQM
jgi:hypothetical protein